jgi:hypothetical protein
MSITRREMVGILAGAACGGVAPRPAAGAPDPAAKPPAGCLDYGRSFVCNTAPFNAVQFWIEYPIKTMNVSLNRKLYQADTGPIALPDLTKRYEPQIDCLRLAFVAFNAPDFADFIVEQPAPVVQGGKPVAEVYHYSSPFSLPSKNTVLAVVAGVQKEPNAVPMATTAHVARMGITTETTAMSR